MQTYHPGDTCYILENNRIVRKAVIVKQTGDFYLIQFGDSNGMTRLRRNRLFHSEQETITEAINNQMRFADRIEIAVGYRTNEDLHGYVDVFAGRRTNRNPHA